MIDFVDPSGDFNAAQYVDGARAAILDITSRRRVPIIEGGTMLYVDALCDGFTLTGIPNTVYEATLGGRILPDHVWFFGGGRLAKTSTQRFTGITNIPYTNGFDEKRYEGKLTLNLTSSQVRRFRIEALHPAYVGALREDRFQPDFTACPQGLSRELWREMAEAALRNAFTAGRKLKLVPAASTGGWT